MKAIPWESVTNEDAEELLAGKMTAARRAVGDARKPAALELAAHAHAVLDGVGVGRGCGIITLAAVKSGLGVKFSRCTCGCPDGVIVDFTIPREAVGHAG